MKQKQIEMLMQSSPELKKLIDLVQEKGVDEAMQSVPLEHRDSFAHMLTELFDDEDMFGKGGLNSNKGGGKGVNGKGNGTNTNGNNNTSSNKGNGKTSSSTSTRGIKTAKTHVALTGQQKTCWKCQNVIFTDDELLSNDELDPNRMWNPQNGCVCKQCGIATYCCELHREQHSEEHKDECLVRV